MRAFSLLVTLILSILLFFYCHYFYFFYFDKIIDEVQHQFLQQMSSCASVTTSFALKAHVKQ